MAKTVKKPARRSGGTMIQRSRSVPASEKAYYHNVSGAGKSHVKREFFGLSEADETWIADELGKRIDLNITRSF